MSDKPRPSAARPSRKPSTCAVRTGIAADLHHGAVVPPIHLSATFAFDGFGKKRLYDYTRTGNPTREYLSNALAELEGGEAGVVTSTGMSAVALVLQLVRPGDLVLAAHDCYGGTHRILRSLAARGHFDVAFVDLTSDKAPAVVAERRPKLLWIETPSNPLLRITDLSTVVAAGHDAGAIVCVDNTFLSPALQRPIEFGADLVVHSTTKYLNGHSDVVGGAVIAADAALAEELSWWANRTFHANPLPESEPLQEAEILLIAIGREIEIGGNAEQLCLHRVAASQQDAFGAMVSFEIKDGLSGVERFVNALTCFTLAESLGGVESLVAHPATMTHASMDEQARTAAGISDSLLRLSIGIEDSDDLAADVTAALDTVLEEAGDSVPQTDPVEVGANV